MFTSNKNSLIRRKFVDLPVYVARNMSKDGNIDVGYWLNKTSKERLAASRMIKVAFQEPLFIQKKCDRTIFLGRRHQQ